eukprot:15456388-Alexandrium_andersonii.AAC.1
MGKGESPPQTLTQAPSEPPPNRRCTAREDAFMQQLGAPRSSALSEHPRPWNGTEAALRGPQPQRAS